MSKQQKQLRLVASILDIMLHSVMMPPESRAHAIKELGRLQESLETDPPEA